MTACGPLCAQITGGAESLPHWGLSEWIWSDFRRCFGTGQNGAPGDEEQEKALALLLRPGGHFRPQCRRFPGTEADAFSTNQTCG